MTIGRGVLAEVRAARPAFLLADATVRPLHGDRLADVASLPALDVGPGEAAKTLEVLERVLDAMVAADLDRRATLVALGGGATLDLGGLASALFMRGVDWVACPTTLLSMVDASVGGKTAVNLAAGKNLAGAFWSPRAVWCDLDVLATLPEEERASGLGEALKTALLAGEELFAWLEASADAVRDADPGAVAELVAGCVRHKAAVVAADEREADERRALNLGHTFAHGIERDAGYGAIPHGVAVAAGIGLALDASAALGRLRDPDLPARHAALARRLGLPAGLPDLRRATGLSLTPEALLEAMRHDKKGAAGALELVLPVAPGRVELGVPADSEKLAALLS